MLVHEESVVALKVEGDWPGLVTLRRGWSRANARPWNDSVPMAHLRVMRGGADFVEACAEALDGYPIEGVLSPPLPEAAQRMWREADFRPHARLYLLRRELDEVPAPDHLVSEGSPEDLGEALRIDAAAFDPFWRFDGRALQEAMESTPRAVIHVVRRPEGRLAGFAVTGMGQVIGYLQRVAVDPAWQRRGIGRSLVRTSARWARRNGARAIVLNTQAENRAALSLYEEEGYEVLGDELAVLRRGRR
jgi:ribosomal protein S18 acetylase RimI-like enzyme